MDTGHPFDLATALEPQENGRFTGATDPAWANMVGPFGGITAAQVLSAVLRHPQRLGDPVALTVNYAAAVADGAFEVVARPARTNRSTQHWTVEMRQQGETVITATVLTAVRRATWASTQDAPMPDVPPPGAVASPAGRGRVEWVRRYDLRFIEGGYPARWDGADSGASRTRLWMRDTPPRPLDFASLAALCDVFFPRIWLRRATVVPMGTVTLTSYFHADAALLERTGTGWVLGQARAQGMQGGYFDQTAQLWNEAGDLLATTHQVVYYKE